jgi:hypothetical protein
MNNYRTIIERFETFVENHPIIKTFTWGDLSDVGRDNEKIEYPLMHIIPTPSSIYPDYTEFTFQLLLMGLLDDEELNQLDLLKQAHLLLQDFCNDFINDKKDYTYALITPVTFQPFIDRLPTRVCGVDATITLRVEGSFCL